MLVMPTNKAPLILFDGVCNLCNASVAWVIEHDRRGAFQFASLQSAAGRAAIAAANGPATLPDSMVLIDGDGVHTQSEAVIRIANRLGFPWKLARLGYLLPRPVRDWAYNTIARNRYPWFGRRESCLVPTPELRARFLDADEPPTQQPTPLPQADPTPTVRSAPVRSFALRWLIAYLFLHMFPFPIGAFPFTEWPAGLFDKLMTKLVPWVGKIVFGLKITIFPGGSGDTTYNYVEVFLFAVVALAIAFAWTLLRRGRPVTPRAFDAMQVLVRYYLGMVMLSYGWHKVIPLQFPVPGPDRLLMSYGDSSPMGLLWAFMGASKAYVIFSGLAEAGFRRRPHQHCLDELLLRRAGETLFFAALDHGALRRHATRRSIIQLVLSEFPGRPRKSEALAIRIGLAEALCERGEIGIHCLCRLAPRVVQLPNAQIPRGAGLNQALGWLLSRRVFHP